MELGALAQSTAAPISAGVRYCTGSASSLSGSVQCCARRSAASDCSASETQKPGTQIDDRRRRLDAEERGDEGLREADGRAAPGPRLVSGRRRRATLRAASKRSSSAWRVKPRRRDSAAKRRAKLSSSGRAALAAQGAGDREGDPVEIVDAGFERFPDRSRSRRARRRARAVPQRAPARARAGAARRRGEGTGALLAVRRQIAQ